ncbi:MAG: extensin family protein [Hyphomicrobiales bacterium]|nr:extensin family protein [Hyphomicrobiales bacterium]
MDPRATSAWLAMIGALLVGCELARAQPVPLPRPRPALTLATAPSDAALPEVPAPPSACRLRLTAELADAPSVVAVQGPGACGMDDAVRLEAVVLADRSRVTVVPPAILRCEFAEAIVQWIRDDVAPAVRGLEARLKSVDNYAAFDCRGRNRVIGARISEHGRGNAIDVRSVRLVNGSVVGLTDPQVARSLREKVRADACARFNTVLGPGSDGYHEDHVHVDLAERRSGYRICHWQVNDPADETAAAAEMVPLPRPRPLAATRP